MGCDPEARANLACCLGFFLSYPASCGLLIPRPGIEPVPPAVEAQNLNHWTTREVPKPGIFDSRWQREGRVVADEPRKWQPEQRRAGSTTELPASGAKSTASSPVSLGKSLNFSKP